MKPIAIALASVALASALTACGTTPYSQPFATTSATARISNAEYYRDAQGQQGQELLQTLAGIVSRHTDLGYDRARDVMFGEVDDLNNDNVVECDYTGRQLSGVTDRRTAYKGGSGLNAEHTWPQSKGAEGAAKADLHHLFPTDIFANSRRSSLPFGEVAKVEWSDGGSELGTDARGETVFEPRDDQKGNTARALLYFYTVYGKRADLSNFRLEETTLIKWHQQDPVTAEERARNDAVQRAQGNRNPYVDHPEYVQAIGSFLTSQKLPAFTVR